MDQQSLQYSVKLFLRIPITESTCSLAQLPSLPILPVLILRPGPLQYFPLPMPEAEGDEEALAKQRRAGASSGTEHLPETLPAWPVR